jgi:S1-C subfamily serine protease
MILHTCPHCANQSMYSAEAEGPTHCRSCGQAFELSEFTKTKPGLVVSAIRALHDALNRVRQSTATIYAGGAAAALLVLWAAISAFGLIPDELRLINRRFVHLDDETRVNAAVGIVTTGIAKAGGQIEFVSAGTAWAVSNDGFMVTNRHVVDPASFVLGDRLPQDVSNAIKTLKTWVYLNRKRFDCHVVAVDTVSDIALIHVEADLPYRFYLGDGDEVKRLNVEVTALGYHEMPDDTRRHVFETPLARTTGTIARVYRDQAGTGWFEHTAAVKPGASGGPLLLGDVVIGINTKGEGSISRALDVAPFRNWIYRNMNEWRDLQEQRKGG